MTIATLPYDPNRIEIVVFDLGGVLIDVEKDRSRAAWSDLTSLPPDTFDAVFFGDRLKHRFNAGEVTEEEFFHAVENRTAALLDTSPPPRQQLRRVWCEMLSPTPQAASVIASLDGKLRMAVLSDTDPAHVDYMFSHFPFLARMSPRVLSYEVGCTKPSPRIYARAITRIALPADRCLFFDDKLANVEASRALGMSAAQVKKPSCLNKLVKPLAAR
jgi:putative hydrolase of the HAD superfamily